jgi:ADP-heptose:LPS heptosyltransferase
MADPHPLVIRFGRLGDLVLTWPALRWLSDQRGPVELVTSRNYAPLMESLPWVGEVHGVEGRPGLAGVDEAHALASTLRRRGHGPVIDLHASLRSRVLCAALTGPVRRVAKQSTARRLQIGIRQGDVRLRMGGGPVRPFTRRFLDAVGAPSNADAVPWWPDGGGEASSPDLALLPGARRATKRWPARSFGALARTWRANTGGEAIVFHGPGEDELAGEVLDAAAGSAKVHADLDLRAMLGRMARCGVAVGADTGLLHLAAAAGAAPVGLFGPTGVDMGYWPWSGRGTALAPDLPCHPCTLYGADRCALEHHRCMAERTPEQVFEAAHALLGAR